MSETNREAPRAWLLPDEPGPEVTAVRDRAGRLWKRIDDPESWCQVSGHLVHHHATWYGLLAYAPLTEEGERAYPSDPPGTPPRVRTLPDGSVEIFQNSGHAVTVPDRTWVKVRWQS